MKHLFVSIALLLSSITALYAQPSVNSGSSELSVTVKRAYAEGSNVIVDFVVTSYSPIWVGLDFSESETAVYDDEGNLYEFGKGLYIKCDRDRYLKVERDIQRKFKLVIADADEYASSISLAKIYYVARKEGGDGVKRSFITIKNIAISR